MVNGELVAGLCRVQTNELTLRGFLDGSFCFAELILHNFESLKARQSQEYSNTQKGTCARVVLVDHAPIASKMEAWLFDSHTT